MNDEKSTQKEYSAEWWAGEIMSVGKELDTKWRTSGRKVEDRYLDDRSEGDPFSNYARKYNIFWSNVQIMKSALYAVPPSPEVKRQHDDSKDDIARTAALILQRMLTFDMQADNSEEHSAINLAVEDRLIPGLGQVWVSYDVQTEKYMTEGVTDPLSGMLLVQPQEAERIVDESATIENVNWQDFYFSPARTWKEVWWVARRVWLKKKKFVERFGQEKWDEVRAQADTVKALEGYPKGFQKGRAEVFEIWCEASATVYWVHCGTKVMLDEKPDPYGLDDFFPCPPPLLATHSTSSLIPRPDYVMCQDQYEELDTLNARINTLTKALRVVGAYDSSNTELATVLSGAELRMVPVDNWAAFAEKGGFKGTADWFPIEQVQKVLAGLVEQRQLVVQQIYELTSISDIMRGVSQSRETAKAQSLKAQYSSVRLQLSQQAVGRFVCGALRIKAEIISKLFQPQTIAQQSQIEHTESAQMTQPAIELIKNYRASQFRIKIGEESLSMADYNAEREMRVEFLTAIGQFLSQAASMVQSTPQAMPYLLRMIAWVAASFRGADDIETVLDEAITQAVNAPPPQEEAVEQKPAPPPPEVVQRARAEADIAVGQAETENKAKLAKQKFGFDALLKRMEQDHDSEQNSRDRNADV